jgi:putative Holliday junction resolvase
MERILALDVGDRRIGAALSDELGITAQPLGTIVRKKEFWQEIGRIVREKEVKTVVIGLPRNMDGTLGEQARKTQEFAAALRGRISGVEIVFRDERLTTVESEQLLLSAGMRREKRKIHRDAIAATLLLQGYLDQKRFELERRTKQEQGRNEETNAALEHGKST